VTSTPPSNAERGDVADDLRRMAPTYIAVLVVEVVTLLALWWAQTTFGA
jgi:hypothetical protein